MSTATIAAPTSIATTYEVQMTNAQNRVDELKVLCTQLIKDPQLMSIGDVDKNAKVLITFKDGSSFTWGFGILKDYDLARFETAKATLKHKGL